MPYTHDRTATKQAVLHLMQRLYSMVEADHDDQGEWTAQKLLTEIREYFHAERWMPQPVYAGITSLVPTGQPLTIVLTTHHGEYPQVTWRHGQVLEFFSPDCGRDGMTCSFLEARKRKSSYLHYRIHAGSRLTIYRGYQRGGTRAVPLYDHHGPRQIWAAAYRPPRWPLVPYTPKEDAA